MTSALPTVMNDDGLDLLWQAMTGGNPWARTDNLTTDDRGLCQVGQWCADVALACADATLDGGWEAACPLGFELQKGDGMLVSGLLQLGQQSERSAAAECALIAVRAADRGQPHIAAQYMLQAQSACVAHRTMRPCCFGGAKRDNAQCAEACRLRNAQLAELVRGLEVT